MNNRYNQRSLSCYLIGKEALLLECAKILLAKGYCVLGVISKDQRIKKWAAENNIRFFPSIDIFQSVVKESEFDYLFSIVNKRILSPEVLSLPRYLTINYHDSPLPKYAGVNATSWAILNGEKKHAISWHIVSKDIDTGDILKHVPIFIGSNESAFTLNMMCYKAALKSFSELADDLAKEENKIKRKKQDLNRRTYFPSNKKPKFNGLISWHEDADYIYRLYKACNFGEYENRFSTLKFVLHDQCFVIDDMRLMPRKPSSQPGTVTEITDQFLRVSTVTKDVAILNVSKVDGTSYTIPGLVREFGLTVGNSLSGFTQEEASQLEQYSSEIFRHEVFWVNQLQHTTNTKLPYVELNNTHKQICIKRVYDIPIAVKKSVLSKLANKVSFDEILFTSILIYLFRITGNMEFSVGYSYSALMNKIRNNLNSLVSDILPLFIPFSGRENFQEAQKIVHQKLEEVHANKTFLKDVYLRYPKLKEQNNFSIFNNILVAFSDDFSVELKKYNFSILIAKNGQYQFSLIAPQDSLEEANDILERMSKHICKLIENIAYNIDTPISDIPLLTQEELKQIVLEWNDTRKKYPLKTVIQLFEEQVSQAPKNTALVFENQQLTYQELNCKANQLANYLRKLNIKPNDIVGIYTVDGLKTVVGILGVLKAGGAYLPIGMDYPLSRIEYMLINARCKVLLIDGNIKILSDKLEKLNIINLDKPKLFANENVENPSNVNALSDLAYVIYTSGSTGKPKGVLIEHRSLTNMAFSHIEKLRVTNSDRLLQFVSFSFDVSVADWAFTLSSGACLHVYPKNRLHDLESLSNYISENSITVIQLPNVVLENLPSKAFESLKVIIGGGSIFNEKIISKVSDDKLLINAYGPTEACVWTTCARLTSESQEIHIGKPITNSQVFVLDVNLQPVPVGIAGELYIGGNGLARGYRIELEEIETYLKKHKGIRQCAVNMQHNPAGDQYMAAYIVSNVGFRLSAFELKNFLAQYLPVYMIPNIFMALDELPIMENGKIDKKRLEHLNGVCLVDKDYIAPQSELEQEIANIWTHVLNIENIGINDNFFTLGGDSISAFKVISELHKENLHLSTKQFFNNPTIAGIAQQVRRGRIPVEIDHHDQILPLTPIQQWYFDHSQGKKDLVQGVFLRSKMNISEESVRYILQHIVNHHDVFRLCFKRHNSRWQQYYRKHPVFDVETIQVKNFNSINELFVKSLVGKLAGKIDIKKGFHLQAAIIHSVQDASFDYLLIIAHHLIIDGLSWHIVLDDIQILYKQIVLDNKKPKLPSNTSSYANWVKNLSSYANTDKARKEQSFWLDIVTKGANYSFGRESKKGLHEIEDQVFVLDQTWTNSLLRDISGAYHTNVEDILLAAFARMFMQCTQKNDLYLHLEGHGREDIFKDVNISRTVGWFTTIYPMYIDLNNCSGDLGNTIKFIKERLRDVPNHGIGYGILRFLEEDASIRKALAQDKPAISFNYLGNLDDVTLESDSVFQLVDIPCGFIFPFARLMGYGLVINCLVIGGCLKIFWYYNSEVLDSGIVQEFGKEFISQLKKLITHCKEQKNSWYTPSDFPLVNLTQHQLDKIITAHGQIENIYPLTPIQEGLLFHSLSNAEAYLVQFNWYVDGKINLAAMRKAWQYLINRHPILRTSFLWEGFAEPIQLIHRKGPINWREYDYRDSGEEEKKERLKNFLRADIEAGFDLTELPILRLAAIILTDQCIHIVITHHHGLMDGWSMPILLGEVKKVYEAIINNGRLHLFQSGAYIDYIKWLRDQDKIEAEKFWKEYLKGFEEPTNLMIDAGYLKDCNLYSEISNKKIVEYFELSHGLSKKIYSFAKKYSLTLNTIFQTIWGILLARYSQSDSVVFGVVVSGRPPALFAYDRMLGVFINTLPFQIKFNHNLRIIDCLLDVQANMANILAYQYSSLIEIKEWCGFSSEKELFKSIIAVENYPTSNLDDVNFTNGIEIYDPTHYPFSIAIIPDEKIRLKIIYDAELISSYYIEQIQGHIRMLSNGIVDTPNNLVTELNFLTPREKCQVLANWEQPEIEYPCSGTITRLFEKQALAFPQNIAIKFKDRGLCYKVVNEKANQLARYLKKLGVIKGNFIGVLMRRSVEAIVGFLGILKIGGVYVPLDADYPKKRLDFILQDTKAKVVLVHRETADKKLLLSWKRKKLKIVNLDDDWTQQINRCQDTNFPINVHDNDLAYAMYTSGSTGVPKGVVVPHRAIIRLVNQPDYVVINPEDCIAHLSTISFDAATFEIWGALLNGASLCIFEKETVLNAHHFAEELRANCSIAFVTTALFNQIVDTFPDALDKLKYLLFGGERVNPQTVNKLLKRKYKEKLTNLRIIHVYGPTENTTYSTHYELNELHEDSNNIPIGKAISRTQLCVVDKNLQLLPIGFPGELCLAGDGLAKGYLNQPELTIERFIKVTFADHQEKMIYKTGDIVYLLPDGNINYIGRSDRQVKVRGFRIELEDIETAINQSPYINESVVQIDYDKYGISMLRAYIVPQPEWFKQNKNSLVQKLREFLQNVVPKYMIPNEFIFLDKLPLASNGKVDSSALLKLAKNKVIDGKDYVEPRTKTQKTIAKIWMELLGISQASLTDNFFELGGHSILILQLLSRIIDLFEVNLAVREILGALTLEKLSEVIDIALKEKRAYRAAVKLRADNELQSSLVTLKSDGEKRPLFLIHPVGGTVFWYISLAKYIDSARPLYAIQDPGIEASMRKKEIPFGTMEDMASYYINIIKTIQPKGPYLLGGASSGSNIAFEMTRQLIEDDNKKVAFTGFLDGWALYPKAMRNRELFEINMRRQYNSMRDKFRAKEIIHIEQLLSLQWQRVNMYTNYNIPILQQKLTLFKAKELLDLYKPMDNPSNYWKNYTDKSVDIHIVPGDHETMFQEPDIRILARELNICLNNIE